MYSSPEIQGLLSETEEAGAVGSAEADCILEKVCRKIEEKRTLKGATNVRHTKKEWPIH